MSEIARAARLGVKPKACQSMLPHSVPSHPYDGLRLRNDVGQAELRDESVTSLLAWLCDCYA